MIRQGHLCRDCTGSKCFDEGTDAEPLKIECPSCAGRDCSRCVGGYVQIDGCPNAYCRDLAPIVDLAGLFQNGIPPVGGGSLDQAKWFIDVANQLKHDEDTLKAEKYR